MSLLDALLPLAAGWTRGRGMKRDRERDEARLDRRDAMDEERLQIARDAAERAAARDARQDAIESENREVDLYGAGFRPTDDALGGVGRDMAGAVRGGLVSPFDPKFYPMLAKVSEAVQGMGKYRGGIVDGKLLDTTETPEAREARATEAELAARTERESEADQLEHTRRLEEIEHREQMQRRYAPPAQARAEPQGSIIKAEDGSYWRVVNGVPEPLTRPDGSPLRAPPTTSGGGGIRLPDGRRFIPGQGFVGGDTAPAGSVPASPTPAQAQRYRELRAQGMSHDQAMTEAMQVR